MLDIFISRPTEIASKYEKSYMAFDKFLASKKIRRRRLGGSDSSGKAPLKAVIDLMKQCKGAIVLGYPQYEVNYLRTKGGRKIDTNSILLPTPWNQIEGTLAYKQKLPVLVVAQNGVDGGIFDYGITGEFVHKTNLGTDKWFKSKEFIGIFKEWESKM